MVSDGFVPRDWVKDEAVREIAAEFEPGSALDAVAAAAVAAAVVVGGPHAAVGGDFLEAAWPLQRSH